MPGNEPLAAAIAGKMATDLGSLETRSFPDGETYLRFQVDPKDRHIILVCTLDRPDPKFIPLMFAADAARELGANKVSLVAPYLCYMRQDKRFQPGEAVTSVSFARMLSASFDALVTVDPHLHRYGSLANIYSIDTAVVHSAPLIAEWIDKNESAPVLIGPDIESEQWVSDVAGRVNAPYRVLRKERLGDRKVEITIPDMQQFRNRTPVLIDDIVSSGRTMIEAARQLRDQGLPAPICIAVHALFSLETQDALLKLAGRVVSSNTVPHPTNEIDVSQAVSAELQRIS